MSDYKSTNERLAVIETELKDHNTQCNDRWRKIEKLHYTIVAFMIALTGAAAKYYLWDKPREAPPSSQVK